MGALAISPLFYLFLYSPTYNAKESNMFQPNNTPTQTPVDGLVKELNNLCVDVTTLGEEELKAYRLQLAKIKTLAGGLMAETATKELNYDDDEVKEYIDAILEDGFNLKATELSDEPKFVDIQKLKRWKDLIAERVEASSFGTKKFKILSLRLLRSNIAKAKTLHELRQAVALMIDPLQLWNDHCVLVQMTSSKQQVIDNRDTDNYIDSLLIEIEEKNKILKERKRVIDELVGCYEDVDQDVQTLKLCEKAKKQHNLSDEEAAKVGGISRKKLLRLRKDIQLSDFMLEDVCSLS